MNLDDKLLGLRRWKLGNRKAIHKPLLILYVLSEYKKGHARLFDFKYEIFDQLKLILDNFTNTSKNHRPEYPFWRLQTDGFWEVITQREVSLTSSGDASKGQLFLAKAEGGFKVSFYRKLFLKNETIDLLSMLLIADNFPREQHKAIVEYFKVNELVVNVKKPTENIFDFNDPSGCVLTEMLAEFEMAGFPSKVIENNVSTIKY